MAAPKYRKYENFNPIPPRIDFTTVTGVFLQAGTAERLRLAAIGQHMTLSQYVEWLMDAPMRCTEVTPLARLTSTASYKMLDR